MQWDASDRGGFTTGEAWLPLADDAARVNVAAQRDDPRSLLTLYRRLLALRRTEPALATGPFSPLRAPGDLLAWVRKDGDRRFLVVLNLGSEPATYAPPCPRAAQPRARPGHLRPAGARHQRRDRPVDPPRPRGRAGAPQSRAA